MRLRTAALIAIAMPASLLAAPACAGPPYVTDDPAPTDLGHWEIYNFANGVGAQGAVAGEAGLDLNYGAIKDVQATFVAPIGFVTGSDGALGGGQVEIAAKFKVLHQDGFGLDVAVFPRIFVPTSGAPLGEPRANLLLPVWIGRGVGKWQLFGGAGYQINPGPGQHNFWTGGFAAARDVTDRLNLGGEIYAHTADADDSKPFVGINVGAALRLTPHWSLLAAGGPGIANARSEGQYDVYVALKADY